MAESRFAALVLRIRTPAIATQAGIRFGWVVVLECSAIGLTDVEGNVVHRTNSLFKAVEKRDKSVDGAKIRLS